MLTNHPVIRNNIRSIAETLDIPAYREYLKRYYATPPDWSDYYCLKLLHIWRLSLYLSDQSIPVEKFIESIHWLSEDLHSRGNVL